ncbi:MAG: AAA family ATPase, partial [Candidatus Limnocylindrales bacterium]
MTLPPPERPGRLLELAVTDLALIDRLRLTFAPGLNVLTGETGAGKSLLIDALGLALGARADTSLVRHGAEAARVEALFDHLPEPRIAAREVTAGGRSTARLDDVTVTASRLAEEVGPLVEIHGQHDQQRLLDERWQRDLLDGFGGHGELRAATATAVRAWRENRVLMDELAVSPHELLRRLELAEHEASEIAAAKLRPGEADEIRGRLAAGQHAESIARGSAVVHDALTAEPGGAREATAQALREARAVARVDPRFEPLAERLAGLEAELADVAAEARDLADSVEHDPQAIAAMEERLGTIYALERRYG